MAKTKLELTWIGKDQRPRLQPRILLEAGRPGQVVSRSAARDRPFEKMGIPLGGYQVGIAM